MKDELYVVKWEKRDDPSLCGKGSPIPKLAAQAAMQYGNHKLPWIKHWIEKVSHK